MSIWPQPIFLGKPGSAVASEHDGQHGSALAEPTNPPAAGSGLVLLKTGGVPGTGSAGAPGACGARCEPHTTGGGRRHRLMRCDQTEGGFFLRAFSAISSQCCCRGFASGWSVLYFHSTFAYGDNGSCYKERESGFRANYRLLSNTLCSLPNKSPNFSILLDHSAFWTSFSFPSCPSISAISLLLLRKYPARRVLGSPFQWLFYKE